MQLDFFLFFPIFFECLKNCLRLKAKAQKSIEILILIQNVCAQFFESFSSRTIILKYLIIKTCNPYSLKKTKIKIKHACFEYVSFIKLNLILFKTYRGVHEKP